MTPPPPPPQMSEAPMMNSALRTPPQRTRKHSQSHNQYSKSPLSSPATSASSAASPTHVAKTQMMMMSPRVRSRMDPYPRYSPRKRLSADYSDGTYSVGSGGDSPRSEKGGWRIHAAVAGPFLTGPLAREFRAESFMSPRGNKKNEPDFDNNLGLLLFPVVPAFVPPAISPEVFQASMQPAATPAVPSPQEAQPDLSTTAPPTEEPYYPPQQTENPDASWAQDQSYAQSYQEEYHQHFYPTEGYQEENHYAAEQYGEYNYGSYEQHYGYEQQYNSTAAETYGYEQSYDGYYAQTAESTATEQVSYEAPLSTNEEAFPPLPQAEPASNQVSEALVEAAPVRRERAPSYADVVTGAAHAPPSPRKEVAKSPKKLSSSKVFADMTSGMAESMSTMLTKAKGGKTYSEVEFACVIHKISTQLKLMGKVSSSLKMEQMKALQKLEKVEAEKVTIEASNAQMAALLKQYEQEREQLKQQLAEALEAKETRLKDAVLSMTQKIDSLKNSKLATEIEAIRKCGSSDDLEKRVEEIGAVLDHLIANHNTAAPASPEKVTRRPSSNAVRRQSVGSWKAVAMYALVVLAASLCGVWVGVKYVGQQAQQAITSQPLTLSDAELDLIVARLSAKFPAIETNPSGIAEALKEAVAPTQQVVADVVEVSVTSDASISTVEVSEPVIEVTREQVSEPTSSSVAQVLYSWRPAMFDLPTAANDASALNGLARALTSLSSQMLADHDAETVTESSVFEVVEEPVSTVVEEPTQVVEAEIITIEQANVEAAVEEITVPEVEATVEELPVITAPVEVVEPVVEEKVQYTNVTEPYSWELKAEELVFSPAVEEPVAVVAEPVAVIEEPVAVVEEPVAVVEASREVVIAESARPTRWVVDQLLVASGVNSGVSAAPVQVEEVVTPVIEAAPVEEVVQVAEPVVATEWALPVQPAVVEVASVKEVQVQAQFSNVSSVVATKESVAVDGMCSLPVVDLRSL